MTRATRERAQRSENRRVWDARAQQNAQRKPKCLERLLGYPCTNCGARADEPCEPTVASEPNPGSGGAERVTDGGVDWIDLFHRECHRSHELESERDSLRAELEREREAHGATRAERDGLVERLTNLCDLWRDLPRDGERAHAFGDAAAAVRHVLITPELSAPQQSTSDSPAKLNRPVMLGELVAALRDYSNANVVPRHVLHDFAALADILERGGKADG